MARRTSPVALVAGLLSVLVALAPTAAPAEAAALAAAPRGARAGTEPTTLSALTYDTPHLGDPITVEVTVGDRSAARPTGTVSLTRAGVLVGTGALASNQIKITVDSSGFAVGHNDLVATYSGDTTFAASQDGLSVEVEPARTTIGVLAPSRTNTRKRATIVVSVASTQPVDGRVVVDVIGLGASDYRATRRRAGPGKIRLPRLPAGRYNLIAHYRGSATTDISITTVKLKVTRPRR